MEPANVHLYTGDEGSIRRHGVTDRHRAHAREGFAWISQVMAEQDIR